jgi:nucleotide-binding universal stress UspA family protein
MYKKVLFPTDFSPIAGHTLSHALTLAQIQEGEVIIQHVVSDYFERLPHWTTIFDLRELQKQIDDYVSKEMARIVRGVSSSSMHIRAIVSKGQTPEEIRALSDEEMVDVIVMGPSMGVITSRVMELADCPVMAVPPAETEAEGCKRARTLLAAVDFSNRPQRLVDHVFRLYESLGVSVYLLHVVEATSPMEVALREKFCGSLGRMHDWALNQMLNLTPTRFVSAPRVHRIFDVGRTADVVARIAGEVNADLVVVGVQDRRLGDRQGLSGKTQRVLMQSGATILAVPA